jgi:hypothetical protein
MKGKLFSSIRNFLIFILKLIEKLIMQKYVKEDENCDDKFNGKFDFLESR